MKKVLELTEGWILREQGKEEVLPIPRMPMQVHEILYAHQKIGDGFFGGKTEDCEWVNDRTWIYERKFTCETKTAFLDFPGLDTICGIWLNGGKVGESRDCYLPYRVSVGEYLVPGENLLQVIFEPVKKILDQVKEEHRDLIMETSVLPKSFIRKTFHDFTTYLGNDEDFYKTGIFRPVSLIMLPEKCMLEQVQTRYTLNERLNTAQIQIIPIIYEEEKLPKTNKERVSVDVQILLDGLVLWEKTGRPGDTFNACLDNIQLWWPRGYGKQTLYEVSVELRYEDDAFKSSAIEVNKSDIPERIKENTSLVDSQSIRIGFRKIQLNGMLNFSVNNVPVKLWGANLTPDDGSTLCEDSERMERLLQLAENANVNTLRIWGEGVPFTDFLYDYADQHGILLWQEFFCGHAQYPNCREVTSLILQEAEEMVKNKCHHPSILLWCGGNECYLSRDFAAPQEEYLAAAFFEYDLKALCQRLDPDRYYHVSSPFYGRYSNEPSLGDTHSYTNSWYVPGSDYPLFASENLRVCFPGEKSLKRYLKAEELPLPGIQKHGGLPWPKVYEKITSAESWKKIPPIEQFYDAETPEEMIYRFGMAAGMYIKDSVERYRRGKKAEENFGERKCMGHFIWKWNTTFPHIYSSMIDAFLEPKIPYYFLKRAYEPVALSIEISDHPDVWVINDTANVLRGIVELSVFDMSENKSIQTGSFSFQVLPGDSSLIRRLDHWGQMTRDKIICGRVLDEEGNVITQNHSYLDIERHIIFPKAEIRMRQEGNTIVLQTDCFARCVELSAGEQQDAYWWDFSDNYFDLFPNEEKRIEVMGKHDRGRIRAKAFYSSYITEMDYKKVINKKFKDMGV